MPGLSRALHSQHAATFSSLMKTTCSLCIALCMDMNEGRQSRLSYRRTVKLSMHSGKRRSEVWRCLDLQRQSRDTSTCTLKADAQTAYSGSEFDVPPYIIYCDKVCLNHGRYKFQPVVLSLAQPLTKLPSQNSGIAIVYLPVLSDKLVFPAGSQYVTVTVLLGSITLNCLPIYK